MANKKENLQGEVLMFVQRFLADHGYPPTYDEIRESVGLSSKSHVNYYLEALEAEGLLERIPNTPRGLRLVGQGTSTFEVSVEGTVAAGLPIELADPPGDRVELTPDIADPRQNLFALRVRGDSMIDDLVGDGDVLIVERRPEVARG